MYYNQELGLCIEFGPVRVDSVRRSNPPCAGSRRRGLLPGLLVIACYLSFTPSSLKLSNMPVPGGGSNGQEGVKESIPNLPRPFEVSGSLISQLAFVRCWLVLLSRWAEHDRRSYSVKTGLRCLQSLHMVCLRWFPNG